MTPEAIMSWVLGRYSGTLEVAGWGERSVFYNPGAVLPRGVYFFTVKQQDGPNDHASALDRDGVYRVSFGVGWPTYERLFGPKPTRPLKGGIVDTGHNFTVMNHLTPHPVYGWMGWLSVLNPTADTFDELKPLIEEAYGRAVANFEKRARRL